MNILLPKTIVRFQDNRDNRGDGSEKDYRSSENDLKKDDPDKLKPHFEERQDLGASSTYKERKLGMIGMSTLALAGLMALASPLLAMAIAFPVLHWRMSKPPQEPPQKDDLDPDLEMRQQHIDDLQRAIGNAKDDANYRDKKLASNPDQPKPILKDPQSPPTNSSQGDQLKSPSTQIDALDLASPSNQVSSNAQGSGSPSQSASSSQIQALDLASDRSSKPVLAGDGRARQQSLAGDLAGIAENLKGDPRPSAGQAQPRRVRFGPGKVHQIE